MQKNRLLNARIESLFTLVIGALSVGVLAVGTWTLAQSFEVASAPVAVAAPLERVVITGSRASTHQPASAEEASAQF